MVMTILCLYGISRCISYMMGGNKMQIRLTHGKLFQDIGRAFQYVIGVILSQGTIRK